MSSRKVKIFWKEFTSNFNIFLAIYLGLLPFLIIIFARSGFIGLLIPTIALIITAIIMIPDALNEANKQIEKENKQTLDILKGNV